MNIAIVGSRGFNEPEVIREVLAHRPPETIVVSGGANGADLMGEGAARSLSLGVLIHYPNWGLYGKSAGYKRNLLIVRDADVIYAFFAPGPRSKGTQHTVDIARAAGKPVHIYHEGVWS